MSELIAGLYEIDQKIGSGGGGVVYIGRHIRLDKTVVLKADKRKLSKNGSSLRREVDLLKGLSQTYIPQVYDFVQDNDTVYTVMDYIDGESLDKRIARGEWASGPEIVKWSCQLLTALNYLHSQPPNGILHGDIKPANIMLRPNGDICLIDYNIALALGENGAVKVGFSRGYASPEHYSSAYVDDIKPVTDLTEAITETDDVTAVDDRTVTDDDLTIPDEPVLNKDNGDNGVKTGSMTGTSRPGAVLLDVRSDIYSLGATLYHLVSGIKPAHKAEEVIPLSSKNCNKEIAAIINKAMSPNPADRYQSAEEMLRAFLDLPLTDSRMVRFRRSGKVLYAALALVLAVGGCITYLGLRQLNQIQTALTLSEYSADALASGDRAGAVKLAMEAIGQKKYFFDAPIPPQVQYAITEALGVYDLYDGFALRDSIKLPSEPFKLIMSPEGGKIAAVYAYEVAVYDSSNGDKLFSDDIQMSALSGVVFSDDETIIYAGDDSVKCVSLSDEKIVWEEKTDVSLIALSGNAKIVACANRDNEHFVLLDTQTGRNLGIYDYGDGLKLDVPVNDIFADSGNRLFALDEKGDMLAVSLSQGAVRIIDIDNPDETIILYDSSDMRSFTGGFCEEYLVISGYGESGCQMAIVDPYRKSLIGNMSSEDAVRVRTTDSSIYIADGNLLARLDPEDLSQRELAYTSSLMIKDFMVSGDFSAVITDDGNVSFYNSSADIISTWSFDSSMDFVVLSKGKVAIGNRDEGLVRFGELVSHEDSEFLTYDPMDEHDEARICSDGETVMLFDYEGFRIYDDNGDLVLNMILPDPDSIYDQQYIRSGKDYLEVTWYDGTVRRYDASDGELLEEIEDDKPDSSLYEEFETESFIVRSDLHKDAVIVDRLSGKELGVVEQDAYLTYITEYKDCLIAEYISTAGERYGLLLNSDLEIIARFPGLCDVWEGQLVFDNGAGSLRTMEIYTLPELIRLGDAYINQ